MKRRALLVGTAVGVVSLGGCLGDDEQPQETDDSNGPAGTESNDTASDPDDFERCRYRIVRVQDLPEPAREQAIEAIDGETIPEEEAIVPALLPLEDGYLRHEGEFYRPIVDAYDDRVEFRLVLERPTFAEQVTLENQLDRTVTVDVTLTHEDPEVDAFENSHTIQSGETVVLSPEEELPYGSYDIDIESDDLDEDVDWTAEIDLGFAFEVDSSYPIHLDDGGVFPDPASRNSNVAPCSWDDDGSVSTTE